MAALAGGPARADLRDGAVVALLAGVVDPVIDQASRARVVLVDHAGHGQHRHITRRQCEHVGLKEQSEAAAWASPGNLDLAHAAFVALDARQPGVQVTGVLEEVKVAPLLVLRTGCPWGNPGRYPVGFWPDRNGSRAPARVRSGPRPFGKAGRHSLGGLLSARCDGGGR